MKNSLLRKDFDLLRNSRSTVPMYAGERELLANFFAVCQRAGESPFGLLTNKWGRLW